MWLAVAGPQGQAALTTLEEHWQANASTAEREAAEAVVDLDADEFTCPACTATFAKAARCPECGLRLG